MPVGNYGVVMNLLQGIVSSEFANNTRHNQGISLFPALVAEVLRRADLTEANARVTLPTLFDGTNDVDVEAGAVRLVGLLVDNTEAAANVVTIYETATVTEGTTVGIGGYFYLKASTMRAWVFPEPLALAALSWSSTDAAVADIEAGNLSAANSVNVVLVYIE